MQTCVNVHIMFSRTMVAWRSYTMSVDTSAVLGSILALDFPVMLAIQDDIGGTCFVNLASAQEGVYT